MPYSSDCWSGPFTSDVVWIGMSSGAQPASRKASTEPGVCNPCADQTASMSSPYLAIIACITCLPFTGDQSE